MCEQEASSPTIDAQRLTAVNVDPTSKRSVASNPSTPAHLLDDLARDQDVQVRQAVASNPNTPWQTLERLAWDFPREFLANPVGSLQIVAHPEQIPTDGLFWDYLVGTVEISPLWWNWLRSRPASEVSQAVRLHVQYAGETAHPFGASKREDGRDLLILVALLLAASAQGATLPSPGYQTPTGQWENSWEQIVRERLQWLACDENKDVRQCVAAHPCTSFEILQILTQDTDPGVRSCVAGNTRTPVEILQTLAVDQNEEVREAVVNNKRVPAETLRILAQDDKWTVRTAVASHRQTPVEVLQTLAQDEKQIVRSAVASNEQTPAEVLLVLIRDQEWNLRREVAENLQTPGEILHLLAEDGASCVQKAVATHPRTPVALLHLLAEDQKQQVRNAVASHPQTPEEVLQMLAQDTSREVRRSVAAHPRTPAESLQILAEDPAWRVRQAVARNPQASVEILAHLALDQAATVRLSVASQLQMPVKILARLALDQDATVQHMADLSLKLLVEIGEPTSEERWWENLRTFLLEKYNNAWIMNAPIEKQLDEVARQDLPKPICQIILTAFATNWDVARVQTAFQIDKRNLLEILHIVQEHAQCILFPFLPPIALQKLSTSRSWKIRYLVALHDQTSQETRQRLCEDGNRYVRAMARTKIAQMAAAVMTPCS